jgi:hypothetical protein
MSLEILIETGAIEERIEKMQQKLQVVPVPAELTAWQSEDMKRRYPNTEQMAPTAARTMIYPRSRRDATWLKKKRAAPRQKPLLRGKATRIVPTGSNRPILRPALFERLRERMNEMMARELKW